MGCMMSELVDRVVSKPKTGFAAAERCPRCLTTAGGLWDPTSCSLCMNEPVPQALAVEYRMNPDVGPTDCRDLRERHGLPRYGK